ncbi:MAG: zinc ribbon domain-containing protein [Methanobacteriota archaeon]|nr:MAG: zinc ribbon domain-containing protein [Euryarchaeota archaeon]
MASPYSYGRARYRTAPSLPFGWGAVTVLLVGAALMIVGIVMILWGMYAFISGTIGAAISDSFSIMGFFSSFFGAMILFVVGGILAGAGGWLVRLWWIFLLVGAVSGAAAGSTVRERDEMRAGDVRVRCRSCGRLNPEYAKFCMSCSQLV